MVLIIDDEEDMRNLVREVLLAGGIKAQAAGPLEALPALDELRPDVVVLDVSMPVVDGHQILQYMRSDPWLRNTFVLLLTARTELEDIETGFEVGADDYLTKPFAIEELVARVRRGLKSGDTEPE